MPGLLPAVDPDGLLEFSVVYTDRALNHMSAQFKKVITDISAVLKEVYGADSTVVIPGSGTYGMEAVARQFAEGQKCLILRNGWFSYRWTQIFEAGRLSEDVTALMARPVSDAAQAPYTPAPIEEVVAWIQREKPAVVFAPHVETASGIILPDDYLRAVGSAVTAVGGLFVLDCIASGAMWVNMKDCHVDVLISAPQKGWSSSPCCALIGLSQRARARMDETQSSSFSCDLKKWAQIMETYEQGSHVYHTTMPTDSLKVLRNVMLETRSHGFDYLHEQQKMLGAKVRAMFEAHGFSSVAAPGFQAPGVVVSYTDNPDIQNGKKFLEAGLQTAAGVPLQCGEGAAFRTFRVGLFGLEKLLHIDRAVAHLETALNQMQQ